MFFFYCTEIAMFRFRCRSGINDYKNIFNAIIVTKIIFLFIFYVSVNCVLYPFIFAIKWVGLGLGVG